MNSPRRLTFASLGVAATLILASCGARTAAESKNAEALAAHLFASVGDDAPSLSKIFHSSASNPLSQNDINAGKRAYAQATAGGFEVFSRNTESVSMASQVLQSIQNTSDGIVVLVGHNQNGHIYFADDSDVAIADLANPSGGFTAVISCSSLTDVNRALGIPDALTYAVAFDTSNRFQRALQAKGNIGGLTRQEAQDLLISSFDEARRAHNTRLVGATGGVAVGGVSIFALVKVSD